MAVALPLFAPYCSIFPSQEYPWGTTIRTDVRLMPGNQCHIAGLCCLGLLPKSSFLILEYEQLLPLDLVTFVVGVNGSESSWGRYLMTPHYQHTYTDIPNCYWFYVLTILWQMLNSVEFCISFCSGHHPMKKIFIEKGLWPSEEANIVSCTRCGCFPDWIGVS